MFAGIQVVGLFFGLFMCFLTFLHYRKNNFGPKSLFSWLAIWIAFLFVVIYPDILYGFMDILRISRTIDFFIVFGFFFFTVIIFYMFIIVKKTELKVEKLVRKMALSKKK